MSVEVRLQDLKVGDEVPAGTIIRDVYLPVWGPDGGCSYIYFKSVPIEALWPYEF